MTLFKPSCKIVVETEDKATRHRSTKRFDFPVSRRGWSHAAEKAEEACSGQKRIDVSVSLVCGRGSVPLLLCNDQLWMLVEPPAPTGGQQWSTEIAGLKRRKRLK